MGAKENINKISKIGTVILSVIGAFSGIATIYCDDVTIVSNCRKLMSLCFFLVGPIIIYYVIGVLQAWGVKKDEKSVVESLKVSIDKLTDQYTDLEKYIQDMEDSIGDKIVCPAHTKTFEYNSTDVTRFTNELLERHPNAEIHIICFGRNGYGDVIEHIREKELKVKAEIIVYNPEADECICRPNDDSDIRKHIRNMLNSDVSVKIYASNIPPSIRACVIYESGQPIWGAMQSYRFEKRKKGGFSLIKPRNSLIPICGERSTKRDFSGMIKCFEEEFAYLLQDYCVPKIVNDRVEFKETHR